MSPNVYWVMVRVCIGSVLLLTVTADDECFIETKVPKGTSYEAVVGGDLEIECKVDFCEEAPPTVDWWKREQTDVPVNVSEGSRIKTLTEFNGSLHGRSVLIFHDIRLNDSGVYQCRSGDSNSHIINVSVNEECFIETRVPKGTSYEAVVGGDLEIECKVDFCEEAPPTVDWWKREKTEVPVNISEGSRIKTRWEFNGSLHGRSVLIFHDIRLKDSGVYQCESGDSNSHNINVSVNGSINPEPEVALWMYMYVVAGIVLFVSIISVVSMCWCQGESKKETQTEIQYVAFPAKQPIPHAGLHPSP
ncbi:hypothetical protein PBY51_016891 [Eleginops maclovinus]|uniref:Ig-like domain-containing protein n=1 Tax=Eleginops maclovinus TaxID=56733 RepID=A0AAN7WUV1_ELEMC|nr:hypothetical protein PBY51_016891 [Eleginops maclovinus]